MKAFRIIEHHRSYQRSSRDCNLRDRDETWNLRDWDSQNWFWSRGRD